MSHSVSGEPPSAGRRTGPSTIATFPCSEWRLLVRLPAQIMIAASSAEPGSPARAVAESLAGLEGIAAGRAFDSDLIRAVVAAVYAESADPHPLASRPGHPDRVTEALVACRRAVRVLTDRADPADSAAYRQWVQSVAVRVCRAAVQDGAPGTGREVERRHAFLDQLRRALRLG